MKKAMNSFEDLRPLTPEQLKAAYSLNMCTVSVSQIIDYNDVYILEQEYDAILNNLNLEEIPKDEPLLKILTEILNTITFFKIQDIKKSQIEKEYQQRIKKAIWSAIPNLSIVVSGSPIAMAAALATQVGIGYMNYRKEKCNALSDKEKSEIELEITAIEQLNALRRELFTTAWRLADTYGFPDCLRLTEKQINQYNSILMDCDELRKYARLESIQSKFYAYPPFWYYFAHTALSIATSNESSPTVKNQYLEKAAEHFEQYIEINQFNILREDQLTASANLEYVDLLLERNPDNNKICELIDQAKEMANNANDILQLCAIAYLKIGKSTQAAELLKILVNEEYNTVSNAKLLSRIYVSSYIAAPSNETLASYDILKTRINPSYLFPMPEKTALKDNDLEKRFIKEQKAILIEECRLSITAFAKQKDVEFNSIIPSPSNANQDSQTYYDSNWLEKRLKDGKRTFHDKKAAENYNDMLRNKGFQIEFIKSLNNTVSAMEKLECFCGLENHDRLIYSIRAQIIESKRDFDVFQTKLNSNTFAYEDYEKLVDKYSFKYFTGEFFDRVKDHITEKIKFAKDLKALEALEYDITNFCNANNLSLPEEYGAYAKKRESNSADLNLKFFEYDLLGDSTIDEKVRNQMQEAVKSDLASLVVNPQKAAVYLRDEDNFNSYFENRDLRVAGDSVSLIKLKAIAVIDDLTNKGYDLILCVDGIVPVFKNRLKRTVCFGCVDYFVKGKEKKLELGYDDEYKNSEIDLSKLNGVIKKLNKILIDSTDK